MNYLAFSRKYRPQNFDEIVGQKHIAATLKNAIINDCVHHAYLFCGSRGVGKTTTARIFAKVLNCPNTKDGIPCNDCLTCKRISTGEDIDVLEIDGASNRGIEEIRNIKNDIKYLPSQEKYKIFIIDEVHMLTQAAFNALLKTLEEPPLHAKFIFATTQVSSIPDTIISRCQRFDFRKISVDDIIFRLKQVADAEKIIISEDALLLIAQQAKGALRDPIVLLEQVYSFCGKNIDASAVHKILGNDKDYAWRILSALADKNIDQLLQTVQQFYEEGGDPVNFIEILAQHLRDILVLHFSSDGEKFIEGADFYISNLQSIQNNFTPEYIMQAIQHIMACRAHLQRGLLGKILFETLLLKIAKIESMLSLESMVTKLTSLEKKIASSSVTIPRAPIVKNIAPPQPKKDSFFRQSPPQNFQKEETQKKELQNTNEIVVDKTQTTFVEQSSKKTDFESKKENFFLLMSEHSNNIANVLRDAKLTLEKELLIIEFDAKNKITIDMLAKKYAPVLQQVTKKVFGANVVARVHCKEKKNSKNNLIKDKAAVENDPVVSLCLELFNGRVVKVESQETLENKENKND